MSLAITPPIPDAGLEGLGISNGSLPDTDVDIALGRCRDEDNERDIVITGTITVEIDVSGEGGLDTGTVAANTFYHVYVMEKSSDGTQDGIFSLANTWAGVTKPTGYDIGRRLGCVKTDATSDIYLFRQTKDDHLNRMMYWEEGVNLASTQVLSAGTSTSRSDVDCSDWCPDTAVAILGMADVERQTSALTHRGRIFSKGVNEETMVEIAAGRSTGTDSEASGQFFIPIASDQLIEYDMTSSGNQNMDIYIMGYEDGLI